MKHLLRYGACLLLAWFSISLWADVPAGTTIYLNTTAFGSGHNCYYIYFSRNSTGYLMDEVPGMSNLYAYTCTGSTQNNVRFGYSDMVPCQPTQSSGGMTMLTQDDVQIPDASRTLYNITGPSWNGGTWEDGSFSMAEVTALGYSLQEVSCVDSTFTIEVSIALTTANANIRISSPALANDVVLVGATNPANTVLKLSGKNDAPATVTITVSACMDKACTQVNNTMTLTVQKRAIDCTDEHTIELCDYETSVLLKATVSGDSCQWKNGAEQAIVGETGESYTAAVTDGAVYIVDTYVAMLDDNDNLMVNGNFESGYDGFTTDNNIQPVKSGSQPVIDPNNFLNYTGGAYGKYYAITSNAQRFNPIFYPILPHGGQYFLIVDATGDGFVWKTSTAQSPALVLTQGESYLFSYWSAFPNQGNELQYASAVLQFVIMYEDPNGTMQTQTLGLPTDVKVPGDLYSWHQQSVTWTAPCNSSNVTIGVKNLTNAQQTSGNGNDFCLDDIMFQPTSASYKAFSHRDVYTIQTKECAEIKDTICLGETYSENGFNETPTTVGDYTLTDASGEKTVLLHVADTLRMSFTLPSLCDAAGTTVKLGYAVHGAAPRYLQLSFSEPSMSPQEYTSMPSELPITIPESLNEGTLTVHVLAWAEHMCPFEEDVELNLNAGIAIYSMWDDVLVVDNGEKGLAGEAVGYQWYRDNVEIPGATEQYYSETGGLKEGLYHVVITLQDSTTIQSCPAAFDDLQPSAELYPGQKPVQKSQQKIHVIGSFYLLRTEYEDGSVEYNKYVEL